MSIDKLLDRVQKVKRTGEGKYLACCPAHDDKRPSLGVKLTNDGKILVHCFAGCDVQSIVSAIGLTLADLMPEDSSYRRDNATSPRFNKAELFDRIAFEAVILSLAIRQLLGGETLAADDIHRVRLAERTINDIAKECRR